MTPNRSFQTKRCVTITLFFVCALSAATLTAQAQSRARELTPENVPTRTKCQPGVKAKGDSDNAVTSVFGKRWKLTEMHGAPVGAVEPYIEFDRERGSFSGFSGCNRISGELEIAGSDLKFARVISTKRACLGAEAREVEADFLRALEATTRFEVRSGTLRLYAGERPVLTFRSR